MWKKHPTILKYAANEKGEIKNLQSGYILKQFRLATIRKTQGYLGVALYVTGPRIIKVHKFVCEAWHGIKPDLKNQVVHKNSKKDDNRPENLYWGYQEDNNRIGRVHNKVAPIGFQNATTVRQQFKDGGSIIDIAQEWGLDVSSISKIINNHCYFDAEWDYKRDPKAEAEKLSKKSIGRFHTKYPPEVVQQMRDDKDAGMTYEAIGIKHGTSGSYAWKIINKKVYKGLV